MKANDLPAILINRFALIVTPTVSRIVFADADSSGVETPRAAVAMSTDDLRELRDVISQTLDTLSSNARSSAH